MGIFFDKPQVSTLDTRTLEDPSAFQEAFQQVSLSRQAKVHNCRFPEDKRLLLGAGLLLQQGLNALQIRNTEISYTLLGKPYLSACKDLHFNLSHSGHFAVCAIYHKEVGIDVQKIAPVPDALIRKIATEEEASALLQLPQEEREKAFAKLWTIKESYLKYIGRGILVSPKRLSLQDNQLLFDGKPANVTLETTYLPGHVMTLCYLL